MSDAAPLSDGPSFLDRGRSLAVVGESLCLMGWLLAALALLSGEDFGLIALILGAAGLILVAVAFFRCSRLGPFATAAGWVQAGGLVLAVVLFVAIPGAREWGKLAAFLYALSALGFTNAIAHLLASIGLRQSGFSVSGTIGLVASVLAIVAGILVFFLQSSALHVAAMASAVAQGAVLAGATARHPRLD